jgi:hypothetical protein
MNYTLAMGSSVHQETVSLIMAAKPLDVIIRQPKTETMNKMVEQMAQMVAPVKTNAWGGRHGSLVLVLDNMDYSSITKARVIPPRRLLNRTPSTKTSWQHQPPLKSSPSKKKRRSFKKNLTCRRWSPTSVSNASLTAPKNSILENLTRVLWVCQQHHQKCSPPSPNQLMQGYDKGTH